MDSFLQRFGQFVVGILQGFDRLRFRGSKRQLCHVSGMSSWLGACPGSPPTLGGYWARSGAPESARPVRTALGAGVVGPTAAGLAGLCRRPR